MAGFLGMGGGAQETPEQRQVRLAQLAAIMSQPSVQKSYGEDRRTQLADNLMREGGSFAPVQGGYTEGIARALSGLAGGYIGRQQRDKYAAADADMNNTLQSALARQLSQGTSPAPGTPGSGFTLSQPGAGVNLAAVQQPAQVRPGGGVAPQILPAGGGATSRPPSGPAGVVSGGAAVQPVVAAGWGAPRATTQPGVQAPTPTTTATTRDLFRGGIVPGERVRNPDGSYQTSFKGAVGPAQVMPGTAREAARLAGVPYNHQRYLNDPEYNLQLGQAYFDEQYRTFGGDAAKAAAAYNAGPGAVTRAVRRANRQGGSWMDYLPVTRDANNNIVDTTRGYVERFNARIGSGPQGVNGGGGAAARGTSGETTGVHPGIPGQVSVPRVAEAPLPDEPGPVAERPLRERVQSTRLAIVRDLLQNPSAMGSSATGALINQFLQEGLTEDQASKMQYDENAAQQQYMREQSDYALRNTKSADRYAAEIGQFTDTRRFNRDAAMEEARNAQRERELAIQQDYGVSDAETEYNRRWALAEREAQLAEEKTIREARSAWIESNAGQRELTAAREGSANARAMSNYIDQFEEALQHIEPGGLLGIDAVSSYVGSMTGNEHYSQARNASQGIASMLGTKIKGSMSDSDRTWLQEAVPQLGSSTRGNQGVIQAMRMVADRENEYWRRRNEQMAQNGAQGIADFETDWGKYLDAVSLRTVGTDKYINYDQWKNREVVR